jgi:hypothetical protein
MNKFAWVVGAVIFFCLGFLGATIYHYERPATGGWGEAYIMSEMVGTVVKNPQGDEFGRITDYVFDSKGRVPFAVLSYGEKSVAIPFATMVYNEEGKYFSFSLPKERLDTAPAFDERALANRTWVEDIYRHFGQAPYWTEEGLKELWSPSEEKRNVPSESQSPERGQPF